MRYAKTVYQYGQPCVEICNGETPFPEGSVFPVTLELDGSMMVIDAGVLREKTDAEKQAYHTAYLEYLAQQEAEAQASKSPELKQAENSFLSLCDQLSGTTTHTKLDFAEILALVNAITDFEQRVTIGTTLLALDSKAKREGGLKWWDTCTWHSDIV